MVNVNVFRQGMQEHVKCYSDLKNLLIPASSEDKNVLCSVSKRRCDALASGVLSVEGEIFGASERAKLFREYMMYHMLVCIIEGRKNYIEALPIEFRGLINHCNRVNRFGLYKLIINSKLLDDAYFAMDVLCPIGDKARYHSLLRVQYNFEIYYSKWFDADEFEKSEKELNSMELELREMNMEMGDMSAKLGAEAQEDRENAMGMIAAAIQYYEEREKIS